MQPLNPPWHPDWDALVMNVRGASFFHSAAWAKTLVATYGYAPNYIVTKGTNALHAVLPLMEVDSWLTGRRGIALPFTDDCEPLCPDEDSFQKLFQRAVELGKTRAWKYLECRGGRKFFADVPASLSFYGHSLDLSPGEGPLWERLDGSGRQAIRKARKNGVTVEISHGAEALETFFGLQCKTRKRHGLPPQPAAFFSNIHQHILAQDLGMVALGKYQGIPIAGAVYFHLGGQAIYKYGASDERFQHLRGSNLVMWEAIKWYLQKGAKQLHLGRTALANEGLRRFKLGWGTTEKKIEYFKYDFQKQGFVGDDDRACGWHNRVFRSSPVFMSRMAGNLLYRHWA